MTKKKRGLGRGLDALLEPSPSPVRTLSLGELVPNRYQPRADFDDAGLEELAESIRTQGVVQPIVVTPGSEGKFTIIAGERRWRAARRAGLQEVPVVIRELENDRQLLEMALVENLQRSDLNAVEEGEAYRALKESFGLSQEEIARQVGRARSTISNAVRLLSLPEEIQAMLRDGRLAAGQARPLLSLGDEERQLELARKAVEEGLTARQLEELVAGRQKKPKPQRSSTVLDPDTRAAADRLTRKLQTKVEIHRKGTGGTVRLHFHTEEELMRLYELLLQPGGKVR
ncbi:MAG: ParB/RepB/Spo0J family partition protein [Nitrospirae bacterium]|nr:ParB/RepB/Spo0J family partition protein [Nitrospirota bacterium]